MFPSGWAILADMCIGCGLCVPTCKATALHLEPNKKQHVPVEEFGAWQELIQGHRKDKVRRALVMARILPHLALTIMKEKKKA